MRIIPHIAKSIESGLKNVVVVSNNTDVCVLLLHYTPQFIKSGLTELWLKNGVGPWYDSYLCIYLLHALIQTSLMYESPHTNRM